jgi:hypothetical protein
VTGIAFTMQVLPENTRKEAVVDVAASASLFSGKAIFSVRAWSKSFGVVEALKTASLDMNAEVGAAKQIDNLRAVSVGPSESRE